MQVGFCFILDFSMGQFQSCRSKKMSEAEMRRKALEEFFARRGLQWPRPNNQRGLKKVDNREQARLNVQRRTQRLYPDLSQELAEMYREGC